MLGLALAAMLVNSKVQQMMPAGPSPDSGFSGLWRVIGAQPAPWASRKTFTKADTPLLEYAVEFRDGVAKGPPPLACDHAQYSSGQTYLDGLFGGKIKGNTAADAKLHLTNPPSTFWMICGKAVREYYIDDDADMLMADGDVIYTLQRPTGMDPEQYKPGFTGPSIDCAKAKTTGEKLICTDAKLAQSDRKLGAAWRKLKQSISPESFAGFQSAQRAWIAYEMKTCGGNGPMPEVGGDRNKVTECLRGAFDARAEMLDGLKAEKAGALVIEPRMRVHTRGNPDTEESDIYPVMSGGPQAAAFNIFITKTLKLNNWRMDDKALFRHDDVDDMKLHAHRVYFVARFDSRVATINIGTSDFVGGHDEERDVAPLAWDMQKSRPFTPDDVFVPQSDWKKFVVGYCDGDLHRQTKADGITDDLTVADLRTVISSSASWIWNKDHATVMFSISMGGGGPGSAYNVDIPYKLLKPYMKTDAPIL